MKKLIAMLIAAAMVCVFTPMVGADPHIDTITVTLNPSGTVSIDVYNTSLGAGTAATWIPVVAVGGTANTGEAGHYSINNTGTVQVHVRINASNTTDWNIKSTYPLEPGHDEFVLCYNLTHIPFGTWIPLSYAPSGYFLEDFPPAGQAGDKKMFDLLVIMPTSSSTNALQTITITFTATAT